MAPRLELLRGQNVTNLIYIGLNIFCVVGIVILNKKLYSPPLNYTYANTLMAFHYVVTALCCVLLKACGVFEARQAPWNELLKLSLSQVGSVAFVNFSLLYNSVGMYQVLKLLNIPVICVMEFFWLSKHYSTDLKTSLLIILAGVAVATVTDVVFSFPGFVHGLLATVSTAVYQILANTKQKQYEINSMQLLHYQAPMTAGFMFLLALMFDDLRGLEAYEYSTEAVGLILLTGLLAFGVNITVFLIVGKTSPVTYQVVGHFKTCLVVLFGFTYLHEPFVAKNALGILIAMVGMVWYTYIKQVQAAPKAEPSDTVDVVADTGQDESVADESGERKGL
eukprot:TRINITY_DN13058_c0_g1_i1.p1 TRINITY_DN13058_c0_g1~~TRINITY_DN13058_c0_g1_i1.p1  ORF type:complete len:336 (-),score=56.68 TRINITY_DN13058_c0_g1_i1:31-1038(-)